MDEKQARRIEKLLVRVTGVLGATYENIAFLDEGGMSAVFTGRHRRLKRVDAIKVLFIEGPGSVDALDRFRGEWETIAALGRSPHIVGIYEANHDENDDLAWLTEEFIDGASLKKKLGGGRLPLPEALAVAVQIARGIEYAHDRGVIHRDIKPGNILIETSGHVVITDFGLARFQGDERMTQTHMAVGTLAFMSPEALRGEDPAPPMDIYSFGVVLFEMFTGRRLFAGADVIQKQLSEAPPDPRTIAPDLPAALAELILSMLQKDAAARPVAAEVRASLEGVAANPFPDIDATRVAGERTHGPAPAPAPAAGARGRRPGARALLGAAVVLAVLAAGAWWWADRGMGRGPRDIVEHQEETPAGPDRAGLEEGVPPGILGDTTGEGTSDSVAAAESARVARASEPPSLPAGGPSGAATEGDGATAADPPPARIPEDTGTARVPTPAPSPEVAVQVGVSGQFRREAQAFRILVDGRDTGLVGPQVLTLPRPADRRVTISLRQLGFLFAPEETTLAVGDRTDTYQIVFRASRP
jgi:hypothetical protein